LSQAQYSGASEWCQSAIRDVKLHRRGWLRTGLALMIAAGFLLGTSAGAGGAGSRTAVDLAPTPQSVTGMCDRAAASVGYRVPCPKLFPTGFAATPASGGCRIAIIQAARACRGNNAWAGWVVGSSQDSTIPPQHLVLVASPRPIRDFAKLVNGPAWYSGARVQVLGRSIINGWRITSLFVPPATNDGSAFAGHDVLAWTTGGHTYAVGFHNVHGSRATLALDRALVQSIVLR
jgi:hypothetical protein